MQIQVVDYIGDFGHAIPVTEKSKLVDALKSATEGLKVNHEVIVYEQPEDLI